MVRRKDLWGRLVNSTSGSGKLVLLGAVLLALALGGCGRKSKLDLPPQAAQTRSGEPVAEEPQRNQLGLFDPEQEDQPAAAKGQNRRIFLDKILD
jgi:predicted small lipoprotein YifL